MGKRKTIYNETTKRATIKYMAENYDRLAINLLKGKKQKYKDLALFLGKRSLTEMITSMLEEKAKEVGFDTSIPDTPAQLRRIEAEKKELSEIEAELYGIYK